MIVYVYELVYLDKKELWLCMLYKKLGVKRILQIIST